MTEEILMMRPLPLLGEPARKRLRGKKCAPLEIRVQNRVPIRVAHAHQQAVACDARVVHKNVHLASFR